MPAESARQSGSASDTSARDGEIAVEQKHVQRVYARVAELRAEARSWRDKGYERGHGAEREAVFEQATMLLERDVMVRHADKLLRALDAEYEGLVFGRLDMLDGEVVYVGRLGVRDTEFENLVTDWRAPAAATFYQATADQPLGVVRRRVIRCTGETVVDINDDLLMPDAVPEGMRVIGEGALMAVLARARGDAMRDIVSTIQREQDDAIRAPWSGVTEITGGPGTGKTAVALHRAAFLLYRDRRRLAGAGVLVVGPSPAFTSYVSQVLPSMGEDSVELRAVGEVLDGTVATTVDPGPAAALKGAQRMVGILRRALRDTPPDAPTELRVFYRGEVLKLDDRELLRVRRAVHGRGGMPNRIRVRAAEALLEALWRKADSYQDYDVDRNDLITEIGERIEFHRFLVAWWPPLSPAQVLGWLTDPQRLTRASRGQLTPAEVSLLTSSWAAGSGYSVADIALLDELRVQLGEHRRRRRGDHDREQTASVRGAEPTRYRRDHYDEYSHVVVDEAQDLSPMQWRMVARRGRYASWTIVGDPVQSSWPDPAEATDAREAALGSALKRRRFTLRTNYRNSAEIFELAATVVRPLVDPEDLPRAVRTTGVDPVTVTVPDVGDVPDAVRAAAADLLDQVEGTVGVITTMARVSEVTSWLDEPDSRLRVVGSLDTKGLEYDAVVLVEPDELLAESITGRRALYVALTRATQRLAVIATAGTWPR